MKIKLYAAVAVLVLLPAPAAATGEPRPSAILTTNNSHPPVVTGGWLFSTDGRL